MTTIFPGFFDFEAHPLLIFELVSNYFEVLDSEGWLFLKIPIMSKAKAMLLVPRFGHVKTNQTA